MPRAGLDAATVTEAGASLADEVGIDRLSMGLLAERLGVKPPSLYKHVASLGDLTHRIAVLAAYELADVLRDATQGRARADALSAGAHAMRVYAKNHPGRYAAANGVRPTGPDDPYWPASARVLASLSAMLRGYQLEPSQELQAMRMLRSSLHGFATLESAGGFQMNADVDESFAWMLSFINAGLRASADHDGTITD